MCCIIETLVRRDRSGKWSEHGRRAKLWKPKNQRQVFEPQQRSTWFQQRNSDQRTSLRTTKPRIVPRTTNTMLGLMQYPQRVLLHKQQKRPRTFLAILKYVAAQQPTDRQFRYSNRPIRCSTQLSRYYGRYHEHPPLGLLYLPDQIHILRNQITTQTSTSHLEPRAKSR